MKYIKVRWLHTDSAYPIDLFSELDEERWERRKVDVFANGTLVYAGPGVFSETPMCDLGEEPVPHLDEIAADPEFEPEEISKDEFELIWAKATKQS